jgi:hypothetical protein
MTPMKIKATSGKASAQLAPESDLKKRIDSVLRLGKLADRNAGSL